MSFFPCVVGEAGWNGRLNYEINSNISFLGGGSIDIEWRKTNWRSDHKFLKVAVYTNSQIGYTSSSSSNYYQVILDSGIDVFQDREGYVYIKSTGRFGQSSTSSTVGKSALNLEIFTGLSTPFYGMGFYEDNNGYLIAEDFTTGGTETETFDDAVAIMPDNKRAATCYQYGTYAGLNYRPAYFNPSSPNTVYNPRMGKRSGSSSAAYTYTYYPTKVTKLLKPASGNRNYIIKDGKLTDTTKNFSTYSVSSSLNSGITTVAGTLTQQADVNGAYELASTDYNASSALSASAVCEIPLPIVSSSATKLYVEYCYDFQHYATTHTISAIGVVSTTPTSGYTFEAVKEIVNTTESGTGGKFAMGTAVIDVSTLRTSSKTYKLGIDLTHIAKNSYALNRLHIYNAWTE